MKGISHKEIIQGTNAAPPTIPPLSCGVFSPSPAARRFTTPFTCTPKMGHVTPTRTQSTRNLSLQLHHRLPEHPLTKVTSPLWSFSRIHSLQPTLAFYTNHTSGKPPPSNSQPQLNHRSSLSEPPLADQNSLLETIAIRSDPKFHFGVLFCYVDRVGKE